MTLKELIKAWENVSWESTLYIEFYKKGEFLPDFIGALKIKVDDINNPKNPYHDLLLKEVFSFRKSVNGIRIYCFD